MAEQDADLTHVNCRVEFAIAPAAKVLLAALPGDLAEATYEQLREARGWFEDCGVTPPKSDAELLARIDREYEGGWPAFERDVEG